MLFVRIEPETPRLFKPVPIRHRTMPYEYNRYSLDSAARPHAHHANTVFYIVRCSSWIPSLQTAAATATFWPSSVNSNQSFSLFRFFTQQYFIFKSAGHIGSKVYFFVTTLRDGLEDEQLCRYCWKFHMEIQFLLRHTDYYSNILNLLLIKFICNCLFPCFPNFVRGDEHGRESVTDVCWIVSERM